MVHHNKHHRNGAQENGKLIKLVVGDHLEGAVLELELDVS
jgi:hypothetical protein